MSDVGAILLTAAALYALAASVFLISENRRPQATVAWLLVFFFFPVLGLVLYVLFGRDTKAFSKQRTLLMQDLEPNARPILSRLLDRQDAEIARLERTSTAHRKLMMLVRRNSRSVLTTRNRVDLQQDAAAFYAAMVADMAKAQHSIHHQYFIWRFDDGTRPMSELLLAKARAGVEVRLLYDPLGSHGSLPRRDLAVLRAAGVRISPTSPLYRLHTISYRNHRKITVVDGAVAYTGGMNIGREHLDGGKGFNSWRDTQVRIQGEGATLLQAVFAVDWYNAVHENLFRAAYFPPLNGDVGDVPMQILTSGPDSQWASIRQLYALMIVSAQRHVVIQSPYFVLDASIAEALRSAALAGVDVKVMLTARPSGDPVPEWASNTYVLDVIDAGVRVFLYEKGYLHAKTISIDSQICSVGSTNIDIRSFSINYELNAVIYSDRVARALEHDFERDLADCVEFDPAEYRRRGTMLRFRDSVARLFSPLL